MSVRKRVAIGVVAALVVATGSGVWIAKSRDSGTPAPSKRVALTRLPRFDDAVVLPSDATADDSKKVQAELDESAAVKAYAAISTPTVEFMLRMQQAKGATGVRDRMCAHPRTRTFAVALTRTVSDARRQLARSVKKDADVLEVGEDDPDVEVFAEIDASAAAVDALHRQIAGDPDVLEYTAVDQKTARAEYRRTFGVFAGDSDPRPFPVSFRLQVRDGVPLSTVQSHYRHIAAVDYVVARSNDLWSHAEPTTPSPEVEVFMQVKATNTQIGAIEHELQRDRRVKRYKFFDHDDAYREFKRLFADQPAIVENETPAGLPTSFRVTLREVNDVASVSRDYRPLGGVKQVNSGIQTCTSKP